MKKRIGVGPTYLVDDETIELSTEIYGFQELHKFGGTQFLGCYWKNRGWAWHQLVYQLRYSARLGLTVEKPVRRTWCRKIVYDLYFEKMKLVRLASQAIGKRGRSTWFFSALEVSEVNEATSTLYLRNRAISVMSKQIKSRAEKKDVTHDSS
jgi:hypothetical protein